MARPSKFDREEAVELAMNEIWRNGYEANSVKALSEKLGITRSSFYNAFGSRDALFMEALARYASQSPDQMLSNMTSGTSVKTIITNTFRAVCRARATDPEGRGCMAVKSITELCNTHADLGDRMAQAVLGSIVRIEALIERGVAQKEIKSTVDIHAMALAVQSLLIGLNVMGQVVRDEHELWQTAETTLQGLKLLDEGAADANA